MRPPQGPERTIRESVEENPVADLDSTIKRLTATNLEDISLEQIQALTSNVQKFRTEIEPRLLEAVAKKVAQIIKTKFDIEITPDNKAYTISENLLVIPLRFSEKPDSEKRHKIEEHIKTMFPHLSFSSSTIEGSPLWYLSFVNKKIDSF